MIEFKDVCVLAKEKAILDGVSLTAREGEITTILGRNGSGKTTLLSCALSLRRYSGEIFADGKSTSEMTRRQVAKKVALMPQILPNPDISVRGLVSLGRTPYTSFSGILSRDDERLVSEAMEAMQIGGLADRSIASLSGGERQRAYFAMILAQGTDIVMADEPTTYMDAVTKKELFSFLGMLKGRKKTVITVLHDLTDAVRVSDRIHLLDGGRLIFSGSADEFAHSAYPKEIFGLEAVFTSANGEDIVFFH